MARRSWRIPVTPDCRSLESSCAGSSRLSPAVAYLGSRKGEAKEGGGESSHPCYHVSAQRKNTAGGLSRGGHGPMPSRAKYVTALQTYLPSLPFVTRQSHFFLHVWDAVPQRLECRPPNRENPGSNRLAAVSKLWQFRSPHVATVHSSVDEYLASGYTQW